MTRAIVGPMSGGTAVVAAALLLLQCMPADRRTQSASDLLQLALAACATLAALGACRRASGNSRLYWALVTTGAGAWAIGQLLFAAEMTAYSPTTASDTQDTLFLLAPCSLAAASVLRPDRPRPRSLLRVFDAALVTGLGLFVYFYVGIAWTPADLRAPFWGLASTVGQAVVAGATLLPLSARTVEPWRTTYRRVAAASLVWFGGNAVLSVLLFFFLEAYRPGLLDFPWAVPFVWLTVAAVEWREAETRASVPPGEPWRDTRRGLVLALGAVGAVATLHLVAPFVWQMPPDLWRRRTAVALASLVGLVALFALRQVMVVRQAEALAQERERELERSEAVFEAAFADSPAAMAFVRVSDLSVVDANSRCGALFGLSPPTMTGRPAAEVMRPGTPPGRDGFERWLSEATPVRNQPARFHPASGQTVDAVVSVDRVEVAGEACGLLLLEDVRERRVLEGRLVQLQRVEAIGRLAAGIAHEFNNQLTAIINAASLAVGETDRPAAVEGYLGHIDRACGRAATLTRQLLAFGRRQDLRLEVLDVADVVAEVVAMLRPVLGEDIALDTSYQVRGARVLADRTQLKQVVLSLAANARDAMPRGGHLTLTVGLSDAEGAGRSPGAGPGRETDVVITVADDGVGMSDLVQRHLFEPFFTTKDRADRGGLGLATAYGIVAQSGGHIVVDSAPDRGTAVRVVLPSVADVLGGAGESRP